MDKIVETISQLNISALLVIGGFEVGDTTLQRTRAESHVHIHL